MNSINKDLDFTVKRPQDFTYYQKKRKSPLAVMVRSGMATQQKIPILANEFAKRMEMVRMNKT